MLIHKASKRERFAQLMRGARNTGLYLFGVGVYVCLLVLVVWVLQTGVEVGVLKVGEAVLIAVGGSTLLHWVLSTFAA